MSEGAGGSAGREPGCDRANRATLSEGIGRDAGQLMPAAPPVPSRGRRLRKCGPISLLAGCVLPVVGATAIHSSVLGLVCVATLLLVCAPLVVDRGPTVRRLAVGLLAAFSVGLSTWLYGGHDGGVAGGAALRVVYLVLPGAVLTPYVDPAALGDHLAQRLHLPARAVVAGTAALQRLEALGEQWQQISRARRARGVGLDGGPVRRIRVLASMTFSLLVSTMRMSGVMALAMDARGFAAARQRTWAKPAPWLPADTVLLLAAALFAALPWVLARLMPGLFG